MADPNWVIDALSPPGQPTPRVQLFVSWVDPHFTFGTHVVLCYTLRVQLFVSRGDPRFAFGTWIALFNKVNWQEKYSCRALTARPPCVANSLRVVRTPRFDFSYVGSLQHCVTKEIYSRPAVTPAPARPPECSFFYVGLSHTLLLCRALSV